MNKENMNFDRIPHTEPYTESPMESYTEFCTESPAEPYMEFCAEAHTESCTEPPMEPYAEFCTESPMEAQTGFSISPGVEPNSLPIRPIEGPSLPFSPTLLAMLYRKAENYDNPITFAAQEATRLLDGVYTPSEKNPFYRAPAFLYEYFVEGPGDRAYFDKLVEQHPHEDIVDNVILIDGKRYGTFGEFLLQLQTLWYAHNESPSTVRWYADRPAAEW